MAPRPWKFSLVWETVVRTPVTVTGNSPSQGMEMEGYVSTKLGETNSAQGNHSRLHRRGDPRLALEYEEELAGAGRGEQEHSRQRSFKRTAA